MPISLLDEQENHFVLHDGNESFPVAKFGLDDTTMGQIRALPQGYADGGFVQSPADDMLAAYPGADVIGQYMGTPPPLPSSVEPTYAQRYFRGDKGPSIEPTAGINFATPEQLDAMKLTKAGNVQTNALGVEVSPEAVPMASAAAPAQAQPSYVDYMNQLLGKVGTGAQQPSSLQLPSEYAQGYQTMLDASRQQAEASAQAAQEQSQIYEQQVKEMQLAEIARQKQEQAVQRDLDTIRNDIATQKIDPSRVWSNMSTGNRVMAGIAIFLGGVAGGMQGRENSALKIIDDAIDKDIDSQKAELGKKQNLLAINLQKYRNIQDAAAATKAQLMAVTQAQVNQAAAKSGSKQAFAAAQMFQGQTELEMGKLKMQLAQSQLMQSKLTDPRGMTAQEAMKMNQDIKDTLVQLPNGQYYPAWNAQSAKNIRDVQADIYNVMNQIQMAKKFMESGYTLPATDRNAKAEMLSQNILLAAKSDALFKLGALTNADIDLIKPLIPDVGSFFEERNKAKLQNLENILMGKLNAYYSANLPGLNPSGRQIRETSVFGGR